MAEKGLDYAALTNAGKDRYAFSKTSSIRYPEGETVEWYGYRRHNFEREGHKGFIVEPPHPATGLPWSWCIQWAEAFVPRTPALKLLERGFHHVFLDVFSTYMNESGISGLLDSVPAGMRLVFGQELVDAHGCLAGIDDDAPMLIAVAVGRILFVASVVFALFQFVVQQV